MPPADDDAPIFLIGFMASGKTTVGRLLAERLDWAFVDLDKVIEDGGGQDGRRTSSRRRGRRGSGSARPRRCARWPKRRKTVVATGGGAPAARRTSRRCWRRGACSGWTCRPRRRCGARARPRGGRLLDGAADPVAAARELLDARQPFYARAHARRRHRWPQTPSEIVNGDPAAALRLGREPDGDDPRRRCSSDESKSFGSSWARAATTSASARSRRTRSPTSWRRRWIRRRPASRCWSTRSVAEQSARARELVAALAARLPRVERLDLRAGRGVQEPDGDREDRASGWPPTATTGAPPSSASAAAPPPTTPASRPRSTCAACRSRWCRRRCWRWSTRRWAARPASISAPGKNLVGAFHQPRAVVADVGFLETLPARERIAGPGRGGQVRLHRRRRPARPARAERPRT